MQCCISVFFFCFIITGSFSEEKVFAQIDGYLPACRGCLRYGKGALVIYGTMHLPSVQQLEGNEKSFVFELCNPELNSHKHCRNPLDWYQLCSFRSVIYTGCSGETNVTVRCACSKTSPMRFYARISRVLFQSDIGQHYMARIRFGDARSNDSVPDRAVLKIKDVIDQGHMIVVKDFHPPPQVDDPAIADDDGVIHSIDGYHPMCIACMTLGESGLSFYGTMALPSMDLLQFRFRMFAIEGCTYAQERANKCEWKLIHFFRKEFYTHTCTRTGYIIYTSCYCQGDELKSFVCTIPKDLLQANDTRLSLIRIRFGLIEDETIHSHDLNVSEIIRRGHITVPSGFNHQPYSNGVAKVKPTVSDGMVSHIDGYYPRCPYCMIYGLDTPLIYGTIHMTDQDFLRDHDKGFHVETCMPGDSQGCDQWSKGWTKLCSFRNEFSTGCMMPMKTTKPHCYCINTMPKRFYAKLPLHLFQQENGKTLQVRVRFGKTTDVLSSTITARSLLKMEDLIKRGHLVDVATLVPKSGVLKLPKDNSIQGVIATVDGYLPACPGCVEFVVYGSLYMRNTEMLDDNDKHFYLQMCRAENCETDTITWITLCKFREEFISGCASMKHISEECWCEDFKPKRFYFKPKASFFHGSSWKENGQKAIFRIHFGTEKEILPIRDTSLLETADFLDRDHLVYFKDNGMKETSSNKNMVHVSGTFNFWTLYTLRI
ncbi:uncharacterized protein LOC131935866 isoform X2 [Physella acuta]|uniref:uncharacterized protein LOC131935866 isoform X2 n=1 Tax=Physella acuta TaxID=109671 RepID=UPI0027DB7327|nr:uncharacterized protein LOC131935866 isoform X2 [Physella acuta]